MPGMQDPMGGDPSMMGGDPNMVVNDPNMMGGEGMEDQEFDAGVDANPDSDPKKYLQQLTGKLSQELRNYNNEQEYPDEDLNKYIAGMVLKQATSALTDKGKNEVLGKLKKGSSADGENVENSNTSDGGDEMPMESISRKRIIETIDLNEIINNILEPDDYSENRDEKYIRNPYLKKSKSPFASNR